MTNKSEILSPAGSWESLRAASAVGADAIYFGASTFNARRNAENFTDNEISAVVTFCHERGIKAFFTLNTVIFDGEIDRALKLTESVCAAGVDAIILQDVGLAQLIHMAAPEAKLHASTQMSAHSLAGVKELASFGFSRVVLARELSAKEIAFIAENSPVELEIFIHGALCMSMSGQCYMSAFFGGCRSGNRGLCAQPCRLPFSVGDANYVLSLKDLSLLTYIRELSNKGVFSLKIEGRMKRPEYVAAATALCVKAVSGGEVSLNEIEDLKAVFSRDGFTQGYYDESIGRDMFGTRSREDVAAATGTIKKFQRIYEGIERPRIKVDFSLTVKTDEVRLLAYDQDGNEVVAEGEKPEMAINRAIDDKTAAEKLSKTGSTPFFAGEIKTQLESGFTVPVSEINLLRRQVLSKLLEKRGIPRVIPFEKPLAQKFSTAVEKNVENLRLRFRTISQIPLDLDFNGVEMIYLPVSQLCRDVLYKLPQGLKVGAELPRAFFGEEQELFSQLKIAADLGIRDVLCGNVGAVNIARRAGFSINCDFGLNITNSVAADSFAQVGAKSCLISFETSVGAIRDIVSRSAVPCGVIVYGRLPLMLVRNCPVRSFAGCKGHGCEITDRTGCKFPVVCQHAESGQTGNLQCSEILNSRPLWIADKKHEILKTGVQFEQFYFTVESTDEVSKRLDAWRSGLPFSGEFTRGLYFHTIS